MDIVNLVISIVVAGIIVIIGSFLFSEVSHLSAIKRAKRKYDRVR